jgi:hypothetical protein
MELKERDFQGVKINFKTMNENRNSYISKFSSALTSFSNVIFPSCVFVTSLRHYVTFFNIFPRLHGRLSIVSGEELLKNLNSSSI